MTYTTKFQSMADIAMSRVEGISPQDVDRLLSDGAIALNIRDREEHDVGHIDGSLNISRGKLEMNLEEQIADLNTVILCYCNANNWGALSAAALCSMGYVNAKYIAGGLKAYRASKIYRSAKIRFLDIADLRKMNS